MAMPIINLPLERIERANGARFDGYVDDRLLNPDLVDRMASCLSHLQIRNAPFFEEESWSYNRTREERSINIAGGLPQNIAKALSKPEAKEAASGLQGSQWVSILRNSMAHGGIVYLDSDGRTARDSPTAFFVFISGRFNRDECGRPIGLNAVDTLRVSFDGFRRFLDLWVRWLSEATDDDA